MLGNIFKFTVFRLLKNAFVNQKIESRDFYSDLPAKLSPGSYHHQPDSGKLLIRLRQDFSEKLFFPNRKA